MNYSNAGMFCICGYMIALLKHGLISSPPEPIPGLCEVLIDFIDFFVPLSVHWTDTPLPPFICSMSLCLEQVMRLYIPKVPPQSLLSVANARPLILALLPFTHNEKCLHLNRQVTMTSAVSTEQPDWNMRKRRRRITDRLAPTLPLSLKLHSNGLNGASPVRSKAVWGQGEGSSWQFTSQLKVNHAPQLWCST